LDAERGILTTTRSLDREQVAQYRLKVIARDRGVPPLTGTAIVTIDVGDVNDNRPW